MCVINLWQVCLTTCILAIFACLAFTSAPAFADEEQAELQDTHVNGGDTISTATLLPLNTNNIVTLEEDSKTVYYKLVLDKDGYISFPDNFKYSGGSIATYFDFYHSDGTCFWSPYKLYEEKLGLAKGIYYLRFVQENRGGWDNCYGEKLTMRINFTASDCWEKESNDSHVGANILNDLSKTYYGSNAEKGNYDYFKFYLPELTNFELLVTSESSSYIRLENSNENKIAEWYQNANISGEVNDNSKHQLSKGWYYLRINPNDKYSFKINATTVKNVAMHRLYNRWTGEHFYTSDTTEKDGLVKKGWSYEGVGWNAPSTSSKPVYRLYNGYVAGGDHHYTMDSNERDSLINRGWSDEGIGWYSDPNQGVPLYRQYNRYAKTGTHNYTTSKSENDNLVKKGWRAEGVSWYGLK